jgi:hypothetical protein
MDQTTRWLSLIAGCLLSLYGLKKLYEAGDWVLVILGAFIVAFSAFGILKGRQNPQ